MIPMYLDIQNSDKKKPNKQQQTFYLLPDHFLTAIMPTFPNVRCPAIMVH